MTTFLNRYRPVDAGFCSIIECEHGNATLLPNPAGRNNALQPLLFQHKR